MWKWLLEFLKAVHAAHTVVIVLFGIVAFRFAIQTRFWLPRYPAGLVPVAARYRFEAEPRRHR